MADEERQDEQQPTPPEEEAAAPEEEAAEGAASEGEAAEGAAPEGEEEAAAAEQAGAGETPAAEGAPDAEAEETPPAAEAPGEQELAGDPEKAPAEEAPAPEEAEAAEQAGADAEEAPAADSEEAPAADSEEAPAAGEAPAADAEEVPAAEAPPRRRGRGGADSSEEEVIPGAHLEPDLVLEEEQRPGDEYSEAGVAYVEDEETPEEGEAAEAEPPVAPAREPLDLAADARYRATGKRKTAVARVILKPGEGTYTINGRHLDQFFPRVKLQRMAQQPLETAGYNNRMDVVAKIHGGGVSAQAGALRHGIARALVEADPQLRIELKRRGFLTRDPRVKERKKAGLKKARKRPQFSKR
jgi:small subunit ribosomal protein S9